MLQKLVVSLFFEGPGKKLSIHEWATQLEKSGQAILTQVKTKSDTEQNRKALSHIIGIERWGQSRLKVALGEPFVQEEYNGYRPGREVSYADLTADFETTRKDTVALAKELAKADTPPSFTILHNQYGDFTVRTWLRYLGIHSRLESKRIK